MRIAVIAIAILLVAAAPLIVENSYALHMMILIFISIITGLF